MSQKKKENTKIRNAIAAELEKQFESVAEVYSKQMRLIEAYDWDEELATQVVEEGIKKYIDLYDYCTHDKTLVKTEDDFNKLLRVNLSFEPSEEQFEALKDLIDYSVKETVTLIKKQHGADDRENQN